MDILNYKKPLFGALVAVLVPGIFVAGSVFNWAASSSAEPLQEKYDILQHIDTNNSAVSPAVGQYIVNGKWSYVPNPRYPQSPDNYKRIEVSNIECRININARKNEDKGTCIDSRSFLIGDASVGRYNLNAGGDTSYNVVSYEATGTATIIKARRTWIESELELVVTLDNQNPEGPMAESYELWNAVDKKYYDTPIKLEEIKAPPVVPGQAGEYGKPVVTHMGN